MSSSDISFRRSARAGAIFQTATYRPLFEDRRARLVGDTLTVQDNRGFATYGPSTVRLVEQTVHLDNATPTLAHIEWVVSGAHD